MCILAISKQRTMLLLIAIGVLSSALLSLPCPGDALPITSKPIEGTAENLAWQAWLMLPAEQKQLEKSRKVTPKSIFTLPNRVCPPGHHAFGSVCLATVDINQGELLAQEVLGLIAGGANPNTGNNQYEFDYEDEDLGMSVGEEQVMVYDSPQNVKTAGARDVLSVNQSPPSKDEPLKFNLFQQNFPTNDYETENAAVEGSGGAAKPSPALPVQSQQSVYNATQFLNAVQGLLHGNVNANNNATRNQSSTAGDLQTESSNISTNFVAQTQQPIGSTMHGFALSDIDAIALPAVGADNTAFAATPTATFGDLEPHRVSLFKDDSTVQLVTTMITGREEAAPTVASSAAAAITAFEPQPQQQNGQQQPLSVAQLLRADSLLPAPNTPTATTIDKDISFAEVDTATVMARLQYPLPQSVQDEADYLSDATTVISEEADPPESQSHNGRPHPRIVALRNAVGEAGEAQELHFSTTEEPEGTTNYQIDDTTVIEAKNELLLEALQPQKIQHAVLKKSKVEPVVEAIPTAIATRATSSGGAAAPTATPLPSATKLARPPAMDDRFSVAAAAAVDNNEPLTVGSSAYERQQAGEGAATTTETTTTRDITTTVVNDVLRSGSNLMSTQRDNNNNNNNEQNSNEMSSTMATSEINIEQELRMINELVKGQRQLKKSTVPTTTTTPAIPTTSETATSKVAEKSIVVTTTPNNDVKVADTTTTTTTTTDTTKTSEPTASVSPETSETVTKNAPTIAKTATPGAISAIIGESSGSQQVTTTTAEEATETESSSTIWSKIMPYLGFSGPTTTAKAPTSTNTMRATTPTTQSINNEGSSSSTMSSSSSKSSGSSISGDSFTNRSHRNSKIIRMPNWDENNLSESNTAAIKTTTMATTTISTEKAATRTTTAKSSNTESEIDAPDELTDPFWWLPRGWRLDRQQANDNDNLLLRFWSAFPESQTKGSS